MNPSQPVLKPTTEQDAVLRAFATGESLIVEAGAGTGKTSTLQMLATQAHQAGRNGLYLAFNKSVATEAQKRFPSSVDCRTVHSVAFQAVGRPYGPRIGKRTGTATQQARSLGRTTSFRGGAIDLKLGKLMMLASSALARFSKDLTPSVTLDHVVLPDSISSQVAADEELALRCVVRDLALKAWDDICDPGGEIMYFAQDYYLKMWALTNPKLAYDYLMLDEGQDTDPVVATVFDAQTHAQQVVVGDENQAIYGWRGAISFMSDFQAAHRTQLSQSFRFGQAIAEEANVWLGVIGANLRLGGDPTRNSRIAAHQRPDAVISRSNVGAFRGFIDARDTGRLAALAGGGTEIKKFAEGAASLIEKGWTTHPDLIGFTTWADAQEYAETDPHGGDIAVQVRLVNKFSTDAIIKAIDSATSERKAEVVFTTAHKAKGREWNTVRVARDFYPPKDDDTGSAAPIEKDAAMIAYVTVTRAQTVLDNQGLGWIDEHLRRLADPTITKPSNRAGRLVASGAR